MKKNISNKNDIVRSYILDRIQQRVYTAGQIIESENKLCEILNVSRMTVRKALDSI